MIAQPAFESLLDRQLAEHETLSLPVSRLRSDGWDVPTLLDLVHDYMEIPARFRRFDVELQDNATGSIVVVTRNAPVVV